jgi:hypothetical protein
MAHLKKTQEEPFLDEFQGKRVCGFQEADVTFDRSVNRSLYFLFVLGRIMNNEVVP